MNLSAVYILVLIIILLVIVVLMLLVKKDKRHVKFTPFAGFSFAFILSGIILGESRLISYSLIGIGVLFALIDIVVKLKNK